MLGQMQERRQGAARGAVGWCVDNEPVGEIALEKGGGSRKWQTEVRSYKKGGKAPRQPRHISPIRSRRNAAIHSQLRCSYTAVTGKPLPSSASAHAQVTVLALTAAPQSGRANLETRAASFGRSTYEDLGRRVCCRQFVSRRGEADFLSVTRDHPDDRSCRGVLAE